MHRLRQWTVAVAFLVCALVPGLAQAQAPAPPATPAPKTEILVFEPYTSAGLNQDLHVDRTLPGLCDTPSQVDVNRPDAWSCAAGGKTYDPCFANLGNSELACPNMPAVSSSGLSGASMLSVVLITPNDPLDATAANTPGPDATPFLIELVDGQFCVPEPKDVRFASLLIYGYCTSGYWFGPGDLSQPQWKLPILQTGSTASISALSSIGVLRLWY
jgi:hypothetical protein